MTEFGFFTIKPLGAVKKVDQVEIRWPSQMLQTLKEVPVNQILRIQEGATAVKPRSMEEENR